MRREVSEKDNYNEINILREAPKAFLYFFIKISFFMEPPV
jgi:hypothetical protein